MVLLGAVVGHLCCADRDFRQTGLGGYQFRLRNLDPYRDDLVAATGKWSNPLQLAARTWTFLGLSALATGASWVAYFRALQVGRAAQVAAVDKLSLLLVAVFAVIPPLSPSSPAPKTKRCTAIFECRDKNYPDTKAWGCEFGTELFIDPTDDVDLENTTSKKMLWVSK